MRVFVRGHFVYGNCEVPLTPSPMAPEVLPNTQSTQKCQDQIATHTYQQDISNHCPVARQKELAEGQEHLWTEEVLDETAPASGTHPSQVSPQLCRRETEVPRGKHMETDRWEGSGTVDPRI